MISKRTSLKRLRRPRCTCCHPGCGFICSSLNQESLHLVKGGIFFLCLQQKSRKLLRSDLHKRLKEQTVV